MTPSEPAPRLITNPYDAELCAAEWMQWMGFSDATATPVGADCGVDVDSEHAVAQVKTETVPVGRPALQRIYGEAAARKKSPLFFSLSGYKAVALAWGDEAGMPLFSFNHQGCPTPSNEYARVLMQSAQNIRTPAREITESGGATCVHGSLFRECTPEFALRALALIHAVRHTHDDIHRNPYALADMLAVHRRSVWQWLRPDGKIAHHVRLSIDSVTRQPVESHWKGPRAEDERWHLEVDPRHDQDSGVVSIPDNWWSASQPEQQPSGLPRLREDVDPGALWVACSLLVLVGPNGGRVSAARLADFGGCTSASIATRLRLAEDAGLIAVQDRVGGRVAWRQPVLRLGD